MKNNYIILKDSNGNKKEYRVLLNIENSNKNVNYIVYTEDKYNKDDELLVYASTYEISDKGNMVKFKPVEMKEEYDFIEQVLSSLEGS